MQLIASLKVREGNEWQSVTTTNTRRPGQQQQASNIPHITTCQKQLKTNGPNLNILFALLSLHLCTHIQKYDQGTSFPFPFQSKPSKAFFRTWEYFSVNCSTNTVFLIFRSLRCPVYHYFIECHLSLSSPAPGPSNRSLPVPTMCLAQLMHSKNGHINQQVCSQSGSKWRILVWLNIKRNCHK